MAPVIERAIHWSATSLKPPAPHCAGSPCATKAALNSLKRGHKPTLGVACGVWHQDVCSRSFRCCILGGVCHMCKPSWFSLVFPLLVSSRGHSSPLFLSFLTPFPHLLHISDVTQRVVCRALFFSVGKRCTEKRGGEQKWNYISDTLGKIIPVWMFLSVTGGHTISVSTEGPTTRVVRS